MSAQWNGPGRKVEASRFEIEQRLARREQARRSLVEAAVKELGAGATRECVARRTGIPVGYLNWKFPSESGWATYKEELLSSVRVDMPWRLRPTHPGNR